ITESDKPSGRQQRVTPTIVKAYAISEAISVFTPETKVEITDLIKQLGPELIILASYGKILSGETLSLPLYGALNLHPSLLPKFRGPTPIQSSILAGEKVTGVSLIRMSAAVDAGELVAVEKTDIRPTDTTNTLKARLAALASRLVVEQLPSYLAGQARLVVQNSQDISQTVKLTKEMAAINWQDAPQEIDRQIRAYNPWPKAYSYLGEKRLIFLESSFDGRLVIKKVQLEGKKPADWLDFQSGHRLELTKSPWYPKIA
ncbi:MAG: methionyl-tRNA formyltransferase, partial [Patescibacteria group bacterium]